MSYIDATGVGIWLNGYAQAQRSEGCGSMPTSPIRLTQPYTHYGAIVK